MAVTKSACRGGVPSVDASGRNALLFSVILNGTRWRVERIALVLGLCEFVFFYVARAAHPEPLVMVRQATEWPLGNCALTWSAAALIGPVFNPWMVFYQQAAVANRHRHWDYYGDACRDTVFGTVLTQLLTAAELLAGAATVVGLHAEPHLETIGDISEMLSATLGTQVGRAVFGLGVVGASMVAAIVASLALAWGVDEWASRDGGARHGMGCQSCGKLDRWFLYTYRT
jgi:Mn2+/Fe2+ NRAMP family transporter